MDVTEIKNEINKRNKSNIVVNASEIVTKERKIISISPLIDYHLNGGIPEGSWVLLSGIEKCGKTTTALQIAANAQQQYDKQVFIGSVEHRIEKKELTGIHNFDIDKVEIIQSTKGKILSAQDHLSEYIRIIKNIPGCILVIDSSSALCSEKELTSDITAQARAEGPKLLATFCRQMASVVPVQDVTLIIIQHLIANTSGYGSPFYEDGGRKIQYQADIKMRCTSFSKWTYKKKQIGQIPKWEIKTSSLGPPGAKFESYLRYGYGIDDIKELTTIAEDAGIITLGGAWYTWGDEKVQGEENLRELFTDPDRKKQLQEALQHVI